MTSHFMILQNKLLRIIYFLSAFPKDLRDEEPVISEERELNNFGPL